MVPPTSHIPSLLALSARKSCTGPRPSSSATRRLSPSDSPMKAKFSGSTASCAPRLAASSRRARASRELAETSGPDVICIAATRGMGATMGSSEVAGNGVVGGAGFLPCQPAPACPVCPAPARRDRSGVHDVELIDAVESLDLQPDRQAYLGLELIQWRRLRLEQQLDHVGMGEEQQLAARRLPALAQDLAEDLVADGFGRLHESASLARGTRLAQQVLQALACALARHLDQPERRQAHYVGLSAIAGERMLERREHLAAVRLVVQIDDDDAAEVAQPQLPADAGRRLEVGPEGGLLEISVTDVAAGVDIDRGHRLPLIDDQVATRLEGHLAVEPFRNLLLDAVQIEEGPRAAVQLDTRRRRGHELRREGSHAGVLRGAVDQHAADATRELIPQDAQRQGKILMYQSARTRLRCTHAN